MECYASQKVLSIKNDSISNFIPLPNVHSEVRIRLMSYRPSMVDAQLVHYKVRVRLMSYRPSMVDVQLVHYKVRVRLMSYRPSMVDS